MPESAERSTRGPSTLDASTSKFEEFLREKYYPELLKAVKDEKAIVVDFDIFDRYDPITADMLLEEPAMMLKTFDEAVINIVEEPIKVRFRNLPESKYIRIRNLRAKHLGKFIQIDATIKSATEVRPQIHSAIFECPDCSAKINVLQDGNLLTKPIMCECGRRGDFPLISKNLIDTRWITGLEPFEITTGEQPGELPIFLKEDLTTPRMQKKTDPGSSLRITGVLKELPRRIKGKLTTKMDIYLEANHVETREIEFEDLEITPEDEMQIKNLAHDPEIYEKLKLSIAPGIYGFEEIKEAVALQLFGGVAHYMPDGSRIRGNLHILLCGDPGTGKSLVGNSKLLHNSEKGPEFTTIGRLIDDMIDNKKETVVRKDGIEICFENRDGIKTITLNPETSRIEWKPVTAFIRHLSPSHLVKIKTRSGRQIIATTDHSFVCMDAKGKINPIKGNMLNTNSYVPIPLGAHRELLSEISFGDQKKFTNTKPLPEKIKLDWNFGFFLGMFLSEGSHSGNHVAIASQNEERRQLVSNFVKTLGLNVSENKEGVIINSKRLIEWLDANCYNEIKNESKIKGSGAIRKKIPDFCFFASEDFIQGLVSGLFSGDGYFVNAKPSKGRTKENLSLGFSTISKDLIDGVVEILSLMSVFSSTREKKYTYNGENRICYETRIAGRHAELLLSKIKLIGKHKINERFSEKDSLDVIPCTDLLYEIVKSLNMSSRKHADSTKRRALSAMMRTVKKRGRIGRGRINEIYQFLFKEAEEQKNEEVRELLNHLHRAISSSLVWDRVKSVEIIPSKEKYVYDLSIDGNETFVCNNLVVHNTVMLKLVSTVVPRGKYVSGSGVSGVGLTASVRKDEIIGTWVLEAGALILANKSVISIDEFDKMSRDDQTAMHEAMSVETVSIAKASIVATLPAQTAVLAGANPQYGRFDTYKTIIEQIQIPETLLSRFDLKFAIIDKPDKTTDEKLADHIIMSRTDPQKVVPVIDLHLLRKYIAYAKQFVKELVLTDEAAQMLKNFYIEMRSPAGEGGPIGITLRQYEALLRLAEASAKVRLDTHIRREDAERAMRLMQFSLRQLGFDRETGVIDIDKLESGFTTGKRKRLNSILEIIEKLQQTSREVAEADILAEAQNQGISEKDAQETIEKLRKDGTIFEPHGGFYRKT